MLQASVESRLLGTPGVINFVDARTTLFDTVVQEGIAAGCTQVRGSMEWTSVLLAKVPTAYVPCMSHPVSHLQWLSTARHPTLCW
jgi:hypothetical protein